MLAATIGLSFWIIIGGIVIEPPATLIEAINRSNERILRLFGRPAAA
jgi:lipopolysaccharide export system permease protein